MFDTLMDKTTKHTVKLRQAHPPTASAEDAVTCCGAMLCVNPAWPLQCHLSLSARHAGKAQDPRGYAVTSCCVGRVAFYRMLHDYPS